MAVLQQAIEKGVHVIPCTGRVYNMLPPQLRAHYAPHVLEDDPELEPIVKGADKLSAYIKCIEEQKAGNAEFDSAAKQTLAAIHAMERPELEWFLQEALPAFALNLDGLN